MDMTYFTQGRTNPNRKATMSHVDEILEAGVTRKIQGDTLKDEIVHAGVEAGRNTPIELSPEFVDQLGAFAVSAYATMLVCSHAPGLAADVKEILESQVEMAPQAVRMGGTIAVLSLLAEVKKPHPDE